MKKILFLILILVFINTTVSAEFNNISYTFDNEYEQTMTNGYKYLGYSGLLKFSVTDKDIEAAGIRLSVNMLYHLPFNIPFVGDLSSGQFSMRFGGRGLINGNYVLTPYIVKNGIKTYGNPINFSISESCVAMTNLRIAYDQIQYIEFEGKEQEIMNYVLPAVEQTIKDGEAGADITKEYVQAKFKNEIKAANDIYEAMDYFTEQRPFLNKLNAIDETARAYILRIYMYS